MTLPSFASFYEDVHGRSPFPWQIRLAGEVLERGWTDLLLDLPTGAGKTSALDVALYCLARDPARMPRRTILVVDRRIVVDQGAEHARMLRDRLLAARTGPAKEIADALRASWGASDNDACFAVAVMRGGMPRDNDWARRPDQPVLGVSTVDQLGSRLLFRGYGIGPRSSSIHAGLVGNDTLILLDEVHLAVPFQQTLEAIRSRFRRPTHALPDRFAVVAMSATATPTSSARVFGLEADDRGHPVLQPRLSARKPARLVAVRVTGDDEERKREQIARRIVDEAMALLAAGARVVGAVVNRVDTARLVLAQLRAEHVAKTDSLLVTGRMRPIDRDRVVREELLPRAGAQRERSRDDRPLIVVATQCIEAGADLDFDGLVTECASLDALRQRFGRVDRRGRLGETRSVIVGRSDLVAEGASDPVYGAALAATWRWLSTAATGGEIDFGIDTLPLAVDDDGQALREVVASAPDAPVMLPAHLDAWAQTSIRPEPDPDISLWLHGPERAAAAVQVVWRAISLRPDRDGSRTPHPDVLEQLAAVRPSALEAIEIPIAAARRWLAGLAPVAIADVVGGADTADDGERASTDLVALRWATEASELIASDQIRPGDVLVVPTSRGGLRHDSFDPRSADPVADLGDLAQLRARGLPTLRLARESLSIWGISAEQLDELPSSAALVDSEELLERARAWMASWPEQPAPGFPGTLLEWQALRDGLRTSRSRVSLAGGTDVFVAPKARLLRAEVADAVTEDDDSAFRAEVVTLERHSTDVRELVERYARALGLGDELVADLSLAAWLHDVGKADPRFQRWLVGGDEIREAMQLEPLAKSALPPGSPRQRRLARERAGYPEGYRHEVLSLAMVANNDDALRGARDSALVLHLVASHHGWCRPFAPPLDDRDDLRVELRHGDCRLVATTRHQLGRLDSGVADRFWDLTERYGWWGLAWLEAILRLADHRASEQAQEDS